RSEYGVMKEKYSADHPDVMQLQKKIVALENEIEDLDKLPEQRVMELKPDNPLYVSLEGQIQGVKTEIKALQERKIQLKAKQIEYEARQAKSPQVERDYLMLTRENNNALMRFQEIKAKQMAAEIGQALEKESKGESFVLIEPAQYPEKPVKPNRLAILFLAFVFSVACGLGLAILQEGLDSSVRGVNGVTKLLTAAPLAMIPIIYNTQDYYRRKRIARVLVSSALVSLVTVVLLVHFFWTPLDVLWFKNLRKAENVIGLD
ncbi:MAG: hypothetical protein OEY89_16260, partial [Gammaproteobacteria bacterium]|nr:hypothetical protein [Gammaproteobacteria bacterium]